MRIAYCRVRIYCVQPGNDGDQPLSMSNDVLTREHSFLSECCCCCVHLCASSVSCQQKKRTRAISIIEMRSAKWETALLMIISYNAMGFVLLPLTP